MANTEKNKLIAEFMGKNQEPYDFPEHGYITFGGAVKTDFFKEQLKFHKSWDWLMPVLKKVREIINACLSEEYVNLKLSPYDYTIEQVYESVVKFIQWYNGITSNYGPIL